MDLDWEEVRELERIVELLDAIELDSKAGVLLEQPALRSRTTTPTRRSSSSPQFRDTQDYIASALG